MNSTDAVPSSVVNAEPARRLSTPPLSRMAIPVATLALVIAVAGFGLSLDRWIRNAHALEAPAVGPCHGPVIDYTFHTYDGPIAILGACGRFTYNAGVLTVDAYDPAEDGIFRSGFDD